MGPFKSIVVILGFISMVSCVQKTKGINDARTVLANKWLIDTVIVPDSILTTLKSDAAYDFDALYRYLADLKSEGYFEFRSDSSFQVNLPPTKIDKGQWILSENDSYLKAFSVPAYYGVPIDSPQLTFEMKILKIKSDTSLFMVDDLIFKVYSTDKN